MYGGAIISEFIPEPTSRRLTVGFLWPDLKRSSGKQSRRQAKSEVIDVVDDEFEDEFQYFKDESDVEDDFDDEVEVEVKPFAFSAAEPRYSNGNVFRPRPPRGPVDPVRCVPKLARLTELNESTGNSEILPIFFDVTPSDVKVKTKLYVEDLDKHEQWPVGESWERWEAALRKVGKSKGWEVQGKAHVEAIELALKEVLHKLSRNKRLLDGKLESREVGRTSGVDDRSARRRISSWQKGEMLGRGSFGDVYKAFTDDGSFLAVKEVSLLDQRSQGKESLLHIEQEISILSQLQHENIVQYHGTKKDDEKLYIFLELMTEGSLEMLYHKYNLSDLQVSAYTMQILNGLKYLHDQNVIHRDIKCANILVDASGSVKLADFGLAKEIKMNDANSSKGTFLWMAPEVVNRKNGSYGLAADIWSLGCTVLEMLTHQYPYSHLEGHAQAVLRIGKGELPQVPNSLSRDARDFILSCLQVNPNNRPSAEELLDHPFVRNASSGFASPHFNNVRS